MQIFPYDVDALLRRRLEATRRPPDGLLHCSGDLCGSLRHAQLRAAGAPTIESDLVGDVRLLIGTQMHTFFEAIFRSTPTMCEVKLDTWLPEGWSGTADFISWDAERRAFVLGDLKTIKPEGMQYIATQGIKTEHQHQLSAYWYALARMGIPLVRGYVVYYLPTGQLVADRTEPSLQQATPLDEAYLRGLMESRWAETKAYLDALPPTAGQILASDHGLYGGFINDQLAPVQDRELRLLWNKSASKKGGQAVAGVEVKWVPHWSANYCPFPTELCDCRNQGVTKVGHWLLADDGAPHWVPSSRYSGPEVNPADVFPDDGFLKKLKEAHDGSG